MNKVQLVGRLVRDPDFYVSEKGAARSVFTLVTKGYWSKKEQKTIDDFVPVTMWGKQAERFAEHAKKGWLVSIVGRVSSSRYEKDGKMIYTLDVIAEEFEFLSKPKGQ
jgi:single-strand DNA-binding protein